MKDAKEICAFCAGVGFMGGLAALFLLPSNKPLSNLCAMFSVIAFVLYVIWSILDWAVEKYIKMSALRKSRAGKQKSGLEKSEDCNVIITKILGAVKDGESDDT